MAHTQLTGKDVIMEFMRCLIETYIEFKFKFSMQHREESDINERNELRFPNTEQKLLMQIFGNALVRTMTILVKINFRYVEKEEKEDCFICKKQFKNDDICRTPFHTSSKLAETTAKELGIDISSWEELPTCSHVFHAKCICQHIDETKSNSCPICGIKIYDNLMSPDKCKEFYEKNKHKFVKKQIDDVD